MVSMKDIKGHYVYITSWMHLKSIMDSWFMESALEISIQSGL